MEFATRLLNSNVEEGNVIFYRWIGTMCFVGNRLLYRVPKTQGDFSQWIG